VGDAYAQVDHYEALFGRKCDKLIDRVAHWPSGARVVRILTKSTISYLNSGYVQENLGLLEGAIAALEPGKRVLVYGHGALRDRVEEWMAVMAERYQLAEWAFEHWWGGRGKDHYNGWDLYLQVSEPIQNIDGMLHVVNARAFRLAHRCKDPDEKVERLARISFTPHRKHSFAHAMRQSHAMLFREHERQNINEQTQAINRPRPVWNDTTCVILGSAVELSRDLLAATTTVVPAESGKETVSKSRRRGRRKEGLLDAFMTPHEILQAMLSVVEWLGVWSGDFAHALVTVAVQTQSLDETGALSSLTESSRIPRVAIKRLFKLPRGEKVDLSRSSDLSRPLGLDQTLVERVWRPPVYWARLNEMARRVKAVETASALLKQSGLASVAAPRWPAWRAKGPGRKPTVHYDPTLFGDAARPDLALEAYYAIMDNQYGVVGTDGRLHTPNAVTQVPTSWAEVPF
jgi:hypothetical protein